VHVCVCVYIYIYIYIYKREEEEISFVFFVCLRGVVELVGKSTGLQSSFSSRM
jgi:hypothetical protein